MLRTPEKTDRAHFRLLPHFGYRRISAPSHCVVCPGDLALLSHLCGHHPHHWNRLSRMEVQKGQYGKMVKRRSGQ